MYWKKLLVRKTRMRALIVVENVRGSEHREVAAVLDNLGRVLRKQGKLDEAQRVLERALATREAALGPDHADMAISLNNLASLLMSRGGYEEALPLIPANAGELNQVWTNLIDNAIDAMGTGGRLTLRAGTADLWVEVEIEDDGPGIPEDLRSVIFEPFFTTKEVGVGTGLGLGIGQRIDRTHQGHIEVRSRPGETVMCVRLPIERISPVEERAGQEAAAGG